MTPSSSPARRAHQEHARLRIRAEYVEMPGMRLSAAQVQRLCGVDPATSEWVLNASVQERFLMRNADGTYVRATAGGWPYAPALSARGAASSKR